MNGGEGGEAVWSPVYGGGGGGHKPFASQNGGQKNHLMSIFTNAKENFSLNKTLAYGTNTLANGWSNCCYN